MVPERCAFLVRDPQTLWLHDGETHPEFGAHSLWKKLWLSPHSSMGISESGTGQLSSG